MKFYTKKIKEAKTKITRFYKGDKFSAYSQFELDKVNASKDDYYPISEKYIECKYTGGDFISALFLCLFLIGFLIFLYMLVVKPKGKLIVIFEKGKKTKICPLCAEEVKVEAKICKHCSGKF